jgi:D-alanyl-D-alanine carboxypeptidase/D-alanyl-D-alanine-endopeptidase (penicillin-binding protein 4)
MVLFVLCIILFDCLCSASLCGAQLNSKTGVLLTNDAGVRIYGQNEAFLCTPASILKILTSLAALDTLGPDYCFSTHYYLDPGTKDLYLKGFGDPLFISEVINTLGEEVARHTDFINHIIIDQTFFDKGIEIPGTGSSLNPYDATVGALCANFNTINFKWSDASKSYLSGETQTPLLPDFLDEINLTKEKKGRILLSEKQRLLYPGLLLKYFLAQHETPVQGTVKLGEFPPLFTPVHVFNSPYPLTEIVQKLLRYSNNFMANQLLLTMGALKYGPPATLEKGRMVINEYLIKTFETNRIKIAEGSGLSRDNAASAIDMVNVLLRFKPYAHLLRKNENDLYKTGTLTDVRTRAGYFLNKNRKLFPYVIMINEKGKNYKEILRMLKHLVETYDDTQPD